MEKIKVLQINKLYFPVTGGIERVVQQIAEGLNDKTDMKVLVCQEKYKTVVEMINNVEIHRSSSIGILFSMPISFSFILQIRKLAKDRDVLHFHVPFPLGDIACLLSGFKGKVVVWWHSDIVRQKRLMKLYRPIMRKFLERADIIIVATQGHIDGSTYLKEFSDKCEIIPFGVEELIYKSGNDYCFTSNKSNKNEKVRFLFVGRLVYYKGCDILIDAFAHVRNAELVVVGNGPMKQELKNKVIQYNMVDKVCFKEEVDDNALIEEFKECDVFVLPSLLRSEAFGLVQIEAMAFGKPVINTRLESGVPFVSLDKITGLTVEPDNKDELIDAMQWMVDNEASRLEMGRNAKQRVDKEYKIDKMLQNVLDIYDK